MNKKIIDGRYFANKMLLELRRGIQQIKDTKNMVPTIAIVLVGDNPASSIYVRNKLKSATEVGIEARKIHLPSKIQTTDLLIEINKLNMDNSISGIIVQMPLPAHVNQKIVLSAICPGKDVDGFHPLNVGYLHSGADEGFVPCTALGCLYLIKNYVPDLTGKNAVIIGRSNIVGKPLSALLLREDCIVTLCHSKTANLEKHTLDADIVVAAMGMPLKLTAKYFNPHCVVIDVGITRLAGSKKIVGDVDFVDVVNKVAHITPVPGGVGPMTIAFLLKNTFKAMLIRER